MNRMKLERFINHTLTELAVGALIVISIVATVLEVKAAPDDPFGPVYELLGTMITVIFIVELSIRFYVARSKRRFFREYALDIIAVIPVVRPLRILRVLRLLRLVRLGILLSRRTRKLASILSEGLLENALIIVILVMVFLIGVIGLVISERNTQGFQDFWSVVWWSVCTLMAGEPIGPSADTVMGKLSEMVLMLGGFTMFAMFTGVVSAVMVDRLRGGMAAKEIEMEDLQNHYIICGWNRSAPTIIDELQAMGRGEAMVHPVVLIAELEDEPSLPETVDQGLIFFVRGDFTSAEILRTVRAQHADGAIILADKSKPRSDQDRDARTILASLTLEKLWKDYHTGRETRSLYSCVELLNRTDQKVKLLEMAGVEDVVDEDEYIGHLVAHSVRAYGLVQVLDELLTGKWGNEFRREPVSGPMTFGEALERGKRTEDRLVIGAFEPGDGNGGSCLLNPPLDYPLSAAHELVVVAPPADRAEAPVPALAFNHSLESPPPREEHSASPTALRDHCVICGYTRATSRLIQELRDSAQTTYMPIVVVAEQETPPADLEPFLDSGYVFFINGDYTATDVLEAARVQHARTAILLADKTKPRSDQDRDARTILAALTIEKMNRHIHTCAELLNRDGEKVQVLHLARVEDIVVGDEWIANLIAHSARNCGLLRIIDELLTTSRGNEFFKVRVPPELVGQTFLAALMQFKREHNSLALAIETPHPPAFGELPAVNGVRAAERRFYLNNPPHDHLLHAEDNLFLIATEPAGPEVLG